MGTKADFYIGRGKAAEWLGSIGNDGFPLSIHKSVLNCTEEEDFRFYVHKFLRENDGIFATEGWPWVWDDSCTSDFSYAFDKGEVWITCFGWGWFKKDLILDFERKLANWITRRSKKEPKAPWDVSTQVEFPDMSNLRNVNCDHRGGDTTPNKG